MDHKTYILEFLEERKVVSGKNLSRNEFKEFIEYLKEQTPWLPEKSKPVFRIKCIVDGVTAIPTCAKEGCCNEVSIKPQQGHERFFDTYIFTEYCSRKCATTSDQTVKKRAETTLERHGVECYIKAPDFKEKATKTNLERYGVEKAHESEIVKERTKKTVRERYGVDYVTQTKNFREKTLKTNIERYGSTTHMHNPDVVAKVRASYLANMRGKHGVDHTTQIDKKFRHIFADDKLFIEFCSNYEYAEDIAEALEYHPSRIRARMAECGIQKSTNTSKPESDLIDFVKSFYDGDVVTNSRELLNGRELDILMPDLGVAIEFNGLYWHSEKHKKFDYHQKKSLDCMDHCVRLIHVWSDDWYDPKKREIVKKKIKNICGYSDERVFARKCKVVKIASSEANKFYDENHIQGAINCKHNYALTYNGDVVACMGFRSIGDDEYDLSRFCSSVSVTGGFSKLLSAFRREVKWKRIETFASLDYSHGEVYYQYGFEFSHITEPNYRYYSNCATHTISRNQAMKHKLHKILENFDENLTEKENMANHGWVRVFDAGSLKFVLSNDTTNQEEETK